MTNPEARSKRADDVKISAFGIEALVPSKLFVNSILFIIGFAFIGYMIRDHDLRLLASVEDANLQRTAQVRRVEVDQKGIRDSLDTLIYVISLPQAKREKLAIDMPESMRTRLLNQERGENR